MSDSPLKVWLEHSGALLRLRLARPKAHIVDGRVSHSILLEIYTDAGIGTQITLE